MAFPGPGILREGPSPWLGPVPMHSRRPMGDAEGLQPDVPCPVGLVDQPFSRFLHHPQRREGRGQKNRELTCCGPYLVGPAPP